MRKTLFFMYSFLTFSPSVSFGDEEYKMGVVFVGGKEYDTSLRLADLHKGDSDKGMEFPVSIEEATILCNKQIEKKLPQFDGYRCHAGTLLNFSNGKVIQLLYIKELETFGEKRNSGPVIYFFVTHDRRVVLPVQR